MTDRHKRYAKCSLHSRADVGVVSSGPCSAHLILQLWVDEVLLLLVEIIVGVARSVTGAVITEISQLRLSLY